jgi:formylglycine-generating enzyme required for sulfatase activity
MRVTSIFSPPNLQQKSYTVGDTTFRMVTLPGMDAFVMGNDEGEEGSFFSEQPKHSRLIKSFSLAEFPVTQQLWEAVVLRARVEGILQEQELPLNPARFKGTNRPIERVNWREARKFCEVLSQLTVGKADFFRLPSEAEWEYAARAGTRERLYAGSNQLTEVGWHDGNSNKETVPVGLLSPNDFGLYDLSGNVWEWCEDDWHDNYKNHPQDGSAWIDGDNSAERAGGRVLRGGSWVSSAWGCRCAYRSGSGPGNRSINFGFRLAAPV